MNNFLGYYYNLVLMKVYKKNKSFYFFYHGFIYTFIRTNRSIDEINAIAILTLNNNKYNELIKNRNNSYLTVYNNYSYILIKTKYKNDDINEIVFNNEKILFNKKNEILFRNNWNQFISRKIDYLEYQREHIFDKYPLINSTFDYYISMAENSIQYFNDTIKYEMPTDLDFLTLTRKRIISLNKNDFYNPLNIVVDYKVRDISEYLKYIFFNDSYDMNVLKKFFNSLDLSKFGYRLLFARMLYPSYYFDEYEIVVNNTRNEDKLIDIIKRSSEYEEYLHSIFMLINSKVSIPIINWI